VKRKLKKKTLESQVSLRLTPEVLARADRLAAAMARNPRYVGLGVTRVAVLRQALLRGLAALEEGATERATPR
jgi:predicted transcriptional regulator